LHLDAGSDEEWECDLERVHGLTDEEEACVCVLIVAKHLQKMNFLLLPEKDGRAIKSWIWIDLGNNVATKLALLVANEWTTYGVSIAR
jgi:hypothetical protein